MKKATGLKIVNPIIGILITNQAVTAVFHESIPYETYELVHVVAGYVLLAAVACHITLNWNWIRTNYFGGRKK